MSAANRNIERGRSLGEPAWHKPSDVAQLHHQISKEFMEFSKMSHFYYSVNCVER
jgi:hypothetical protein